MIFLYHASYSEAMVNGQFQECEMLKSARIKVFMIMSGVADACKVTGSCSQLQILLQPCWLAHLFISVASFIQEKMVLSHRCSQKLCPCVLALSLDLSCLDLSVLLHLLKHWFENFL
jgi:hypothetical protein